MKAFLVSMGLFFIGCVPYTKFVSVSDRTDVPTGSKEIIAYTSMDNLLSVLKSENILYNINESGVQTEDILIDEATRARINVYEYEGALKIVPYWGITGKAKQQASLWAGYGAAAMLPTDLQRIAYNKRELRPKMVFDYAADIALKAGDVKFQ